MDCKQPAGTVSAKRIAQRVFAPVDIAGLVYFRVIYGCIMGWNAWRYLSGGWVEMLYVTPKFHFTYYGFDWVRPWPGDGMYLHFYALLALSVCVVFGLFYRVSSLLLFLGFTYAFLLDVARYQNHYYLLCLVGLVMVFVPAHRACSIDVILRPKIRRSFVAGWTIWLLRFQIGIPYFFAGLAKLHTDWLTGSTMRILLSNKMEHPIIGPFFAEDWMIWIFTYGSLLFDLGVVPLLLWQRTRAVAFAIAVLFHILNAALFQIGIFPWFMLAATAVFLPPTWPRRIWRTDRILEFPAMTAEATMTLQKRGTLFLLTLFASIQIVLPLRHFAYPGNVNWTEEGARFAWRMMLRSKVTGVRCYARVEDSGQIFAVDPRRYLTARQFGKMGKDPDMLVQFAHLVAGEIKKAGNDHVEVRLVVLTSLNQRKPQLLIDPNVDLANERRSLWPKPWIVPLKEPVPNKPWQVPIQEWDQYIEIPIPFSGGPSGDSLSTVRHHAPSLAEPD